MVEERGFAEVLPVVTLAFRALERLTFIAGNFAATVVRVLLAGFTLARDLVLRTLPASDDFAVVVRFFGADLVVGMSFSLGVRTRPL